MAAAQSQKKKKATQPQKRTKQSPHLKTLHKKILPKQKKLHLMPGKGEQKKLAVRQMKKTKEPEHPSATSKVPQQLGQRKASLPTKGNGKTGSFSKNVSSNGSSQAKCPKMSRNICTLSFKEIYYELNEMMRRQMTACMFPSNPCAPQ